MGKEPHPFEQQPTDHAGWCRRHFEHQGRQWAVLTTDRPDEQRSQVWPLDRDARQPWPHFHHFCVDVILTVDAAAAVIGMVYRAHSEGLVEGAEGAKAAIRRVMGCK